MNSTPARVESFYTAKTWVSPDAVTQLSNASLLPGMVRIAAMPDIHPGAGSPGGVVFASRGVIYPKLIGGDIGCGMQLFRTSIDARVNVRRLADSLGSIDDVWDGNATEYLGSYQIELPAFERVLGTIGGGNHFSLAHGAGRKISRSQSDEKFGQIEIEELRRPRDKSLGLDNLVICEQRNLLRQEHGKAYKDIERVIDDMKTFGLLEIVATFRPILTYKTRSDSDDGEG